MKETRELTLINKYGLHVRPAGLFAKIASHYCFLRCLSEEFNYFYWGEKKHMY